ncbi:MAG: transglycosylase domain-containing protein [Alphaproteobacteria bacterium]
MRVLFRLIEIVLIAAVAGIGVLAVSFWLSQGEMIERAQQEGGALHGPISNDPLSLAERAIVIDEFSQSWGTEGVPCRTAALVWADIAGSGAPPTPVSQRLASMLLSNQHGASVRWQLSRLVIACQLEQRFDDTQMLRAWLSKLNFGHNISGVDDAAQAIFGEAVDKLDAEESAKLAALVRNPGLRDHPDLWAQRAQAIVVKMAARAQ